MLEQIHPSATKAKDDRYYNMEPDVRNLATRKNYMAFWEQGMHVKHDNLNQSGKVIYDKLWDFLYVGRTGIFLDILSLKILEI